MLKRCPYCEVEKPLDAFYKSHQQPGHPCKPCNSRLTREWRASLTAEKKAAADQLRRETDTRWRKRNREKISQSRKRQYQRNPTAFIEQHYKNLYGITLKDKRTMCDRQNWCCAICAADLFTLRDACVDHCHTTKIVRGILCSTCNGGLGLFKDNTELLMRAISYLEVAHGRKEAA